MTFFYQSNSNTIDVLNMLNTPILTKLYLTAIAGIIHNLDNSY